MATITLYKDKINGVGSLLDDIIKSSNNLNAQLGTLKNTLQGVDSSTCNLQDTVNSISSSSKSEKDKVEDLKRLNSRLTEFIEMTTRRDASAKSEIERAKKDFYTKYSYLKPECEKSRMEKIVDAMKKACEWCKEHWKLLVTIVIVAVSIVLLCTGVGAILAGACWGAILGAVIGGVSGGLDSMARGGSFLDGFEDGAFSGAITGAITGAAFAGLGQLGAVLGKGIKCTQALGKFVKGTAAVTKVISTAMGGFDTIALLDKAFGTGDIAALNAKLHENKAYNIFQIGVTATAIFTGGMTTTMKCFVAGTLVLTANGLIAIESIKQGDLVYAADEDTLEVSLQPVLETYIRETANLVHITINGENIISTFDHPYFVKGKGFVSAEKLWIGAELVDNNGNTFCIEQIYRETLENQSKPVYNFKADKWHTYFVGSIPVLVHNANYNESRPPLPEYDGKTTEGVMVTPDGEQISFSSGNSSSPSYPQYKAQSASHVEGKAALYMRENGISEATVYHNNPNGTCGFCDRQVPALLPEGAKLTVVPPSNSVANNARAIPVPKTYTGNSTIPSVK